MDALKSLKNGIIRAFTYPQPFNWGYPVFFGALGMGVAFLLLKALFTLPFPVSSTSLIGCAVSVLVIVLFSFVIPSVLLAEKGGLNITGRYTGIGALILAFLSGAPLFLVKAAFRNLFIVLWFKLGGSAIFPSVFYYVEEQTGLMLLLEILADTVIPAFGFALFFYGAVWKGFSDKSRRWAFVIIPILLAMFSFDVFNVVGILVIGWWLCILRDRTENIYAPILSLIGARFTGILIDSVVVELDITSIKIFSDIPNTIYYSAVPALIVAVILLAFFRKALDEFHISYSADVYGDSDIQDELKGRGGDGFMSGVNLTLVLGIIFCFALWIVLFNGVRI